MAWQSSGSTHEEMVDSLKRNGLISSKAVERGFRSVDRKLFVPPDNRDSAYSDQPLREGKIHISAPHIYCSALEALELEEDSSISFLNIGSGTGYLSCIVAEILGPKSLNYGIEIYQDTVKHSKRSIEKWRNAKKESDANAPYLHFDIIHGNVFQISSSEGESSVGFDRIYVGAAISKPQLSKITKLLSPGGILVGPVEDELVKIIRIGPSSHDKFSISRDDVDNDANDDDDDDDENDEQIAIGSEFTQQVLSSVRFAPFVSTPYVETVIPARVWSPDTEKYYPDSFQQATKEILLCSNLSLIQPLPPIKKMNERINLAAMLPKVLWMEILSYTHRKWFDTEETEISYTRKRLIGEQNNAAKAHAARLDAERRCQLAEKERDVYRLLARRMQSRLHLVLQQQQQLMEAGSSSTPTTTTITTTTAATPIVQRVLSDLERTAIFVFGPDSTMLSNNNNNDDEVNGNNFRFSNINGNDADSVEGEDDDDETEVDDEDQNGDEEMTDSSSENQNEFFSAIASSNDDDGNNSVLMEVVDAEA